jgi:hypothetical protein
MAGQKVRWATNKTLLVKDVLLVRPKGGELECGTIPRSAPSTVEA